MRAIPIELPEITADHRIVLDCVFSEFERTQTWPKFARVRALLENANAIEAPCADLVHSMWARLISYNMGASPSRDDQLKLTIRGLANCQELAPHQLAKKAFLVVRLVGLNACDWIPEDAERYQEPIGPLAATLGIRPPDLDMIVAVLDNEEYLRVGSVLLDDGAQPSIQGDERELRAFADTATMDDFLAVEQSWYKQRLSHGDLTPAPSTPTTIHRSPLLLAVHDHLAAACRDVHDEQSARHAALLCLVEIEGWLRRLVTRGGEPRNSDVIAMAFHPETGKLTDTSLASAQRIGVHQFAQGVFGRWRNALAHGDAAITQTEAVEIIGAASLLARQISRAEDRLTPTTTHPSG